MQLFIWLVTWNYVKLNVVFVAEAEICQLADIQENIQRMREGEVLDQQSLESRYASSALKTTELIYPPPVFEPKQQAPILEIKSSLLKLRN